MKIRKLIIVATKLIRLSFIRFKNKTVGAICAHALFLKFKTDLKSIIAFCGFFQRMMISRNSQNSNKLGRYCSLPPRKATFNALTLGKGALSFTEFLSKKELQEHKTVSEILARAVSFLFALVHLRALFSRFSMEQMTDPCPSWNVM